MFGIKLKGLKKSGRFNDLKEAYSSLTSSPPLDGVIRGQPLFIAIFTVKILKFGTPQTIAIIVLKIEKFDVTLH